MNFKQRSAQLWERKVAGVSFWFFIQVDKRSACWEQGSKSSLVHIVKAKVWKRVTSGAYVFAYVCEFRPTHDL